MHPITSAAIARLHREDLNREAETDRTAVTARGAARGSRGLRRPRGSRAATSGERYFAGEGRSIDQWSLIERLADR